MSLKFELICIDLEHKVKFRKPENFVTALSIIENLWIGNPTINVSGLFLEDTINQIKVSIQPFDTSKMATGERYASAFMVTVEGEYDKIEPFRLKIIEQIRDLNFKYIKILNDDVSDAVAKKIFPLLNIIENSLRRYIVKFFLTKIGIDWWTIAISKEVRDKSNSKKSNEVVFTRLVVADVTLLDFSQIGKIIYSQSSVFTKVEDVIDKIKSATDIESLRTEILEGNYAKYFKDTFEQKDFQKKWEDLTSIRNKVAHNNYCVEQDFQEAKDLVDTLTQILKDADNSIEAFNLSIADKEAVKKAIDSIVVTEKEDTQIEMNDETKSIEEIEPENEDIDSTNSVVQKITFQPIRKPTLISESELIEKLKFTARNKEFVGLKFFVREVLGKLGYSFDSSYALINLLADKGKLEIYAVNNPMGLYDTTAVKLIE